MIIKINNLSKTFNDGKKKKTILENLNLSIKTGQSIAITGRSGCGKSTLFKLAYGLIKPTSGRVTINDIDTYLLPNEIKNKYFSIVYQDYFFSNGTIKEEITLLNNNISEENVTSLRTQLQRFIYTGTPIVLDGKIDVALIDTAEVLS